jgi:hypothetical protein
MTGTTSRLQTAVARVERWLFDPVPAYAMLICRVGLGGALFLAYLSRWPLVEMLYGPSGYAGYEFRQRFAEHTSVGWSLENRIDILQRMASSELTWVCYLALLVCSLLFAMGVRPRLTGTIALGLHILFVDRNPGATWGWATMIKPFMVYSILAASPNHWSVTGAWQRARGRSFAVTEWSCSAWPQRLMQIHITCVFLVLWSRFDEPGWVDGQALALALTNRDWGRLDIDWFPYFGWLEYASIAALVLECGAPIALWIKPIARFWALGLIGMFVTLILTTSVGWWDVMMMCVLVVFLPPEWLERLASRDRAPLVEPRETGRVAGDASSG